MKLLFLDTQAQMAEDIERLAPIFIGINVLFLSIIVYTLIKAIPQYRKINRLLKQTKKAS